MLYAKCQPFCPKFNVLTGSLSPGKSVCDFKCVNFNYNLGIDILGIHVDISMEWMPVDLIDSKSTLVQVMAWCRQATSHYLSQCWPISMFLYGITKPQSVPVNFDDDISFQHTMLLIVLRRDSWYHEVTQWISYKRSQTNIQFNSSRKNTALMVYWLWPSDAMWQHRSWSTLFQAMACYLTWTNVDFSSMGVSGINFAGSSQGIF